MAYRGILKRKLTAMEKQEIATAAHTKARSAANRRKRSNSSNHRPN